MGEAISDLRSHIRHITRTAAAIGLHAPYRYDLAAAVAEISRLLAEH